MTISQAPAEVCTFSGVVMNGQVSICKNHEIPLPGTDCTIRSQVPLAAYTSYKVGGPAEWYASPRNLEALQATMEYAKEQDLPVTVLGAGSNLLVSDRGIPGLVISTRHLRFSHFDAATGQVTIAAGEPLPGLAMAVAELGLQGLEWSVGIPGTVGGAVVMNAGAHQSCIADIFVSAQVLTPDGKLKTITKEELGYSYRTSLLQGGNHIITQATFQLQPGADPVQVVAQTRHHKQHRLTTQPYDKPSCGSVFRNPQPYAAGWLIEQSGLKGFQIGKAQVAQRHANFIVNCGGASAGDIFHLIRHIQQQVQQNWSIILEPEVKMIGDFQGAF
ncbi:UDP-N-acetylmuramate dehydrogenase [Calothrix sp. 336/3]|uniref:UDP-N-acetylmuramate dehydrogenase n=1 Tax=Calothrix sp. 336/3 TaxID=1337936 RepID=UPI0004E2FE91|nr:UDP-N-acetylmuramate dehydrogenase [Calothrix sp. 336/3]AKG23902.1 UDP-N-acetylenolpyruvoylglucosamine reductase [Calothrix sp. 336/3]